MINFDDNFFFFLIFFVGGIEAGLVLSAVSSLLMLLHFMKCHRCICRMVIVIVAGVLRKRRESTSAQITIRSSFEYDWLRR